MSPLLVHDTTQIECGACSRIDFSSAPLMEGKSARVGTGIQESPHVNTEPETSGRGKMLLAATLAAEELIAGVKIDSVGGQ